MQSEAQKRAQIKYRAKMLEWRTRLPADIFERVEAKLKEEGLSRRQFLEKYLEQKEPWV